MIKIIQQKMIEDTSVRELELCYPEDIEDLEKRVNDFCNENADKDIDIKIVIAQKDNLITFILIVNEDEDEEDFVN